MLEIFSKLVESKSPGAQLLLVARRGSHVYGTALPTSDEDYAGIYIQSLDDILGFGYKEQINDDSNDTVFYEIKRFLELASTNNPTILELLYTPEDCILYKHPSIDEIIHQRAYFLTKNCGNSFGGYAVQQIKKAKGQNKKQNWEKDKVSRKDVLDFCYVIEGGKSIPWKEWNSSKGYDEKFIGAVNIPNARDLYALYFDDGAYSCFSENLPEDIRKFHQTKRKKENLSMGFGYKGLVKIGEGTNAAESNQLRLSSVPKGETPICSITYNKDGYTMHCKDYNEYQEWLQKRNLQRWVDVESHGQKIDGKNMMHCRRLLQMAKEIAEGKGIQVRRPDAKNLLAIRMGEINLESLIHHAESDIKEIEKLFEESDLPETIDRNFVQTLLIDLRKKFYFF